jgi:hypothetical protein
MTTAEQVAELFGNDGMAFELSDGRTLPEVCREFGATESMAIRRWDNVTEEYRIEEVFDHTTNTIYRYTFDDGSAIVVAGDGWDIEGDEPFSWAGA